MILTVTPNPSLDLLFEAERLVRDDANRVPMPRRRPGGQGINVVRAARALEPTIAALAVAPMGGPAGRELREVLEAEQTPLRSLDIDGDTRVFVAVRERQPGTSLLLNPSGPTAAPDLPARILGVVREEVTRRGRDGWLVCCGSLLPGLPPGFYRQLCQLGREHGWKTAVDCDGEPLAHALDAADLVVPNAHEAERLVGRPVRTVEEAVDAALRLRRAGPAVVAVTLGADGAVLADGSGVWTGRPALLETLASELEAGSPVGAGDAFLAALLLAMEAGAGSESVLRAGVAAGTAVLYSHGQDLVRAADVDRLRSHVVVEPVDPG